MVLHFFDKKMTWAIFGPLVSGFSILQVAPRKCGWYVSSLPYTRHGNRWDIDNRIILGCVEPDLENLPMASPWPPHGDKLSVLLPAAYKPSQQSIMSANRLPCEWERKGASFGETPHGLPMASPWPPHGEPPHGEKKKLLQFCSDWSQTLIQSRYGYWDPTLWISEQYDSWKCVFERPPHGLPMASPWGWGDKKSCPIDLKLWEYEDMGCERTPCECECLNPSSFVECIKKINFLTIV